MTKKILVPLVLSLSATCVFAGDNRAVKGSVICKGSYRALQQIGDASSPVALSPAQKDVVCEGSFCETTTIITTAQIAGHLVALTSQLDFFKDNTADLTAAVVDLSASDSPVNVGGKAEALFASDSTKVSVRQSVGLSPNAQGSVQIDFECSYQAKAR